MKNTKEKIKSATLIILEILVNAPFAVGHAFLDPHGIYETIELNGYKINRIPEKIKYLERKGYITINERNRSIEITHKGSIKLLENSIDKNSDGRWRFLSFDIPEEKRATRNRFRRLIKKIGFKQVQKSLWACPYNKADQIETTIRYLCLEKYVAYFIAEKTDIDKLLNSIFKDTTK